ncbi:MAG: hypothetical protein SCABRO_01334 [Candidatus Scalindua brodae]|uniref:Polymerase/histidinol phosphatase N-terminal domain-containing protein n=1 Tax=Candidatus Scalindua brodae TaxID=237368 RepID=A0A0B0EQJ6_9BACT|nr:MAG: hypothetical protein SCABRO_01334 [Candidatus Scalindua brodae]
MLKRIICILFLGLVSVTFCIKSGLGESYQQVAGLIDLRTTYSDGAHDLDFLIALAKKRGFDLLFINDHDRMTMEYGIFPLKNIIRKREELPSINSRGVEKYLQGIKLAAQQHPEIILIPGSETAPFYYWTGSPFKGNLTAHNWERHLLILGLEKPQDYKNLPVLHNGFSTRYSKQLLPISIAFLVLMPLGFILALKKGYFRILGIVILVNASLMLIEFHPFKSSLFDQYSGDQGYLPYQELIDYVGDKGGMTFWTHPEAGAGVNARKGPITVKTPKHPESLLMTRGYTGFATIYGTWTTVTEPGKEWDRVLLEYCRGERNAPAWGISTADYHKEGGSGRLGDFPTVFLVKKRTREEVLSAIKQGRMYACRTKGENFRRFVLEDFSVSDSLSATSAIMGNTIILDNNPKISIKISSSDKGNHAINVSLSVRVS